MKFYFLISLISILLLSIIFAVARPNSIQRVKKMDSKRTPVIVELFTSEGCSSCPPADDLLAKLEKEQPISEVEIIPLSEHVDYWNRLGWADPYSSEQFTNRQSEYANAFGNGSVYTPQMVVDGHVEFVGNDSRKAYNAITKAALDAKKHVQIGIKQANDTNGSLTLSIEIEPLSVSNNGIAVVMAITEAKLFTNVARGENSGRNLKHTAVVRELNIIGKIGSSDKKPFTAQPTVKIANDWKREDLQLVVFAQDSLSRQIYAAGAVKLF